MNGIAPARAKEETIIPAYTPHISKITADRMLGGAPLRHLENALSRITQAVTRRALIGGQGLKICAEVWFGDISPCVPSGRGALLSTGLPPEEAVGEPYRYRVVVGLFQFLAGVVPS